MTIQELIQHIPHGSAQDMLIKVSGVAGGGTVFAGLTLDMSHWSELAQIFANFGIFIGGVAAFGTFAYSLYKGRPK